MGYSCTMAAMDKLNAIQERLLDEPDPRHPGETVRQVQVRENVARGGYPRASSNTFVTRDGRQAFHEIGRENDDGAVTGTVWVEVARPVIGMPRRSEMGRVRRAGSFRIEPDGRVSRFPLVPSCFYVAGEDGRPVRMIV